MILCYTILCHTILFVFVSDTSCLHTLYTGHWEGMPRGIPNTLHLQDDRAKKIDQTLLPTPSMATASYEHGGGHITAPRPYGEDPLAADGSKRDIREKAFHQRFSFENIFESAVNGNSTPFENAFLFYVDVSFRLSHSS